MAYDGTAYLIIHNKSFCRDNFKYNVYLKRYNFTILDPNPLVYRALKKIPIAQTRIVLNSRVRYLLYNCKDTRSVRRLTAFEQTNQFIPMLRIRMRMRILGFVPLTNGSGCGSGRSKNHCCGSMTFWGGSGSGSADPCL